MPIFGRMYLFNRYQHATTPPSSSKSFIGILQFLCKYKIHSENNIYNSVYYRDRSFSRSRKKYGINGLKLATLQRTHHMMEGGRGAGCIPSSGVTALQGSLEIQQ